MLTLSKTGVIFVCTLTSIIVWGFTIVAGDISPDKFLLYVWMVTGLTFICVGMFMSIFSNSSGKIMSNEHDLTMKLGWLTARQGSPERALSFLARELLDRFAEQNELNALHYLNEEQAERLRVLDDEIPVDKEHFAELVQVAFRWGVHVPETWQYRDWILPLTPPEIASHAAATAA